MLQYPIVKNWHFGDISQTYTARDTMLYALGIGMGADPVHEGQLRFVYERDPQAVPTMASVLGSPGFWYRDPRTGIDFLMLVHGEQAIRLLKPIPPATTIVAKNGVVVAATGAALPAEWGLLRFQLWNRDSASMHLRASVDSRGAVVLNNGLVELG